jgi:hypothetical protein
MEPYKNHSENLSNVAGKHDIKELQKTAILGTAHAHVLQKLLM